MGGVMEKFKCKKKYGQNFISDINLIKKIISFVDINKNDLVVEVGPGKGALTLEIAKLSGFSLIYEIDKELEPYLSEKLNKFNNYKLVFNDFLKVDLDNELANLNYKRNIFISNLPYYITTPIVKKVIDSNLFDIILVMLQEEVADRFSAKESTKEYGSLTVYLNAYYDVKKVLKVNKTLFNPVPNVDSAIVVMKKKDNISIHNTKVFNSLVRDSFKFKRKTLRNNLKNYDVNKIEEILVKYNLSMQSRAEDVPADVYIEIANYL